MSDLQKETICTSDEPTEEEIEIVLEAASLHNRRFLRPKEIAAFLLTSFGQKNLSQFTSSYRQFFMISFLGLSGSAYGLIMFFETIYDALDDSLSGLIIDRTRTRWGRLRPYLLIPTPFWATSVIMLFMAPAFLEGDGSKIVWATVAIFINNLGMSYFGAWGILLYNITPNLEERNNLIATSKFMELFGVWLPSLVPIFVSLLPKKFPEKIGMQDVYTGFAAGMAIVAAVTAIYGFFAMRERVPLATREQMKEISIWDSIKNAFKNRPMFILLLSNFFNGFKSVGGSIESFYWYHNTGSLINGTISGLFTGLPNYVITPLSPKIIRKFGARNSAIFAGVFGGVMYTLLFFVNPYEHFSNKYVALACTILLLTICGLPNCLISVCTAVLQGDVYDYSEWKTGVRNEALVATISGYFGKLANSVTGLLSGLVITWVGYKAHTDELGNIIRETDHSVLMGFFAVFALMPAIARFLYGINLIFFNVHGKFKDDMNVELGIRRLEKVKSLSAQQTSLEDNNNGNTPLTE